MQTSFKFPITDNLYYTFSFIVQRQMKMYPGVGKCYPMVTECRITKNGSFIVGLGTAVCSHLDEHDFAIGCFTAAKKAIADARGLGTKKFRTTVWAKLTEEFFLVNQVREVLKDVSGDTNVIQFMDAKRPINNEMTLHDNLFHYLKEETYNVPACKIEMIIPIESKAGNTHVLFKLVHPSDTIDGLAFRRIKFTGKYKPVQTQIDFEGQG